MTPKHPMPTSELEDLDKVRRARLDAADMISPGEAARLIGVNAVEIDELVSTLDVLAIRAPGEAWRLPAWQFEEPLSTLMPLILVALNDDGWGALHWLETSLGALDGLAPRAAVEQGQGFLVVMLAKTGSLTATDDILAALRSPV